MPGGKQRRELIGTSIEEARDAEGKRRSQKRENRIFDILPESKIKFRELSEWYLGLTSVKKLDSYDRIIFALNNFNSVFGNRKIISIKQVDIEDYQERRAEQGRADATIDMEIKIAQTMVTKAFDNDLLDGRALKAFRKVKRRLKKGSNARKRTLTFDEYIRLVDAAPQHLKAAIKISYFTGMRSGEIRTLQWPDIDRENGFIRLSADATKEARAKVVPINQHVKEVLFNLPRALKHDFVITYHGKPIKQKDGLKRSFKSACFKAKIPCGQKTKDGLIFHDIRRTVKTNMLSAGVDKAHRDTILGHSLHGMDVHYLAPTEESLSEAMDRYTKWVDEQLEIELGQRLVNTLE